MTDKPDPIFAAGMAALADAFNKGWNEAVEAAAEKLDKRAEHLGKLMRNGQSEKASLRWQSERANITNLARDMRRELVRPEAQHTGESGDSTND